MFQEGQDLFNILMETVSEGVIIADNHQKIIKTNTSVETIFGYTKKELLGKDLNYLTPANYYTNNSSYYKNFIKKGKHRKLSEALDFFALKKDGIIFPIEVELNPFLIYNQTYVIVVIKDVSENKEIKKNLMLRSKALQSSNNGIIITNALKHDNPVIYFNPAFQKLTGYSDNEILNHNCRFLQGKDRDQIALKNLRESIKKGESCQATLRNYKKDGTLFWNDLYIFPITNNKGKVTNFIGIQNDITLKKNYEEERLHLASIFEESLNEIYVCDAKTLKFINANLGAQKNIGYTLEELKKMTPLDIKPNEEISEFTKIINTLFKNNINKIEYESIHYRKNGTSYPVETHLQLSKLKEKDVFVAFVKDITERKNYSTELEKKVEERTQQLKAALTKEKELNNLKTRFLSLVSHEFKTPLSGIITSSLLISKHPLTEHQKKRDFHLKTIIDKVYFLNNIINDFLSIEKLETSKTNYQFNNFKLSKIVDELIINTKTLLKDGQQIKSPNNIDEITLYQDEKIIQLILFNLLDNAIKYSSEDSIVELSIKQDFEFTTIMIKDNGIGIPEKDQESIFERYFRAKNVINTQGTGIGLNISKNNLKNIGGSISFKSKECVGSTFTITIPNKANQ